MTNLRTLALLPVLALATVACGDDSPSRGATAVKGDAFCTASTKVDDLANSMGEALFSGDPKTVETALAALITAAESARKLAPTDIQENVTVSVDGFKQIQSGLKKFNWDIEAAAADPEFGALLASEEQATNGDELQAYLDEKCGIAES